MDNFYMNLGGRLINLSECNIMSIINITPDSFYEGSRVFCFDAMLNKIEEDLENGAKIFDIGGYSSRPNCTDISVEEEIDRVCTAIQKIKSKFADLPLSVDTFRAKVIETVVNDFGAVIVNDISAGEIDNDILDLVAKHNLPYIAMHMKGTPATMQTLCQYEDVVFDVIKYFTQRIDLFKQKGIQQIIVDPGFGFAKTVEQNFIMLKRFEELKVLGYPILAGVSRKSMIFKTLDCTPKDALNGTTALHWQLVNSGANILRVHDVKAANEVIKLQKAMGFSE